jgi:hypothetical protein
MFPSAYFAAESPAMKINNLKTNSNRSGFAARSCL